MLVGKLSICNLSQALKCIGFFFDNIVFAVKSSELIALLPNIFYCIGQCHWRLSENGIGENRSDISFVLNFRKN